MNNTWPLQPVMSTSCVAGYGMCVSLKHGLAIVSGWDRLWAYSLSDGHLVRGCAAGHMGDMVPPADFVTGGLCLSPDGDNILLAERKGHRVREVRIADASLVRFIGERVLQSPHSVDCNADVLVVSEACHCISVLSWHDGELVTRFGSKGSGPGQLCTPRGLRLLVDGSGLVVADRDNHRLCVFGMGGEFVHTIGSQKQGLNLPMDVLECASGGGFAVANFWANNLLYVADTGVVEGTYSTGIDGNDDYGTEFSYPSALAALPDDKLVIRDDDTIRIYRGRTLRHAWISVCVVIAMATWRTGGAPKRARSGDA